MIVLFAFDKTIFRTHSFPFIDTSPSKMVFQFDNATEGCILNSLLCEKELPLGHSYENAVTQANMPFMKLRFL